MAQPADIWDKAIAEAYASAPANSRILYTIELRHPAFTEPVRVVHWPIEEPEPGVHTLTLEPDAPVDAGKAVPFVHCGFALTLPQQSERAPGEFVVRIDNVTELLTGHLVAARKQRTPIDFTYREYLESMPEEPQLVYHGAQIRKVSCSAGVAEGRAEFVNWLNKIFGRQYTPGEYPGLVRGR
ncbi:DUF1833 family protein [Oleidesulfovibrio alaskensis]|jgi:hypothetical protein